MSKQSLVTPYFTRPLFRLRKETVERQYINVSNKLEVEHRGESAEVFVEVPAALFTVLRTLKVATDRSVTMFLEDDGPRMLFGIMVDDEQLYDLWHYTMDQIHSSILL